jgi:hypothetical protein
VTVQTEVERPSPAFEGTKKQVALLEAVFGLYRARGMFFSDRAPIVIPLQVLAEQLSELGVADATEQNIEKALAANPSIFRGQEIDGALAYATTRLGTLPPDEDERGMAAHDLRERFTIPEPPRPVSRPRRDEPASEKLQSDDASSVYFPPDSWQAAIAAALQQPSQPATLTELTAAEISGDLAFTADAALDSEVVEAPSDDVAAPFQEEPDTFVEGEIGDVARASDEQLAEAVRLTLSREIEIARWGDTWMIEEQTPRLSRGDIRKVQDFLEDAGAPLRDTDIVRDLYSVNPNAPDFASRRFALNFRLSRESREFEYLGTDTAGLWALPGMAAIGSDRRKASEIGQDYRFLLDYRAPDEGLEDGIIEHVLTFYEFHLGVLPLNANVARVLPKAAFTDQRAARLTFESPQTLETVEAELRFPTSNRGGYVIGLEMFFAANLVPGAVLTIEHTEEPAHYILEYFQMSRQDRKLLQLDERKNRYVFRSTTYYCATQDEMLLSDSKYPKLENMSPLDDRDKRRPEIVVATTFERIGENVGGAEEPRYRAGFSELLAVANVERPISEKYLRDILTGGTYPEFQRDENEEDAFFYNPTR